MTDTPIPDPLPLGIDEADVVPASGWREEIGATFRLSWPLALANLLQMLTYAVDVIFIARLGEQQLAASALAVALFGWCCGRCPG